MSTKAAGPYWPILTVITPGTMQKVNKGYGDLF